MRPRTEAVSEARRFAREIRRHALHMVHRVNSSHIGSVFSMADLLAVLYTAVLRVDPAKPEWPARDRFILSKGHATSGVYAAVALRGFVPLADLDSYGVDGSDLMAHVSHKVPGVEFSTGALGHGLPFGTGKALAAKLHGDPWRVFVMLGDGEMDEGSNWEALMFAAHHRLDNLVALIDCNNLQSLTTVAETLALEPLEAKLQAFGCAVREVDGHDHAQVLDALATVPWAPGKPSVLIARTIKGKGVGYMENRVEWHYRAPNAELLATALAELDREDA
jgi:transketolase